MCVFAAPALLPLANATAVAGTAGAAGGIFGLGAAASNMFLAQLGLTAVTSGMQMQQANRMAQYQGQAAVNQAESANRAAALKQEAFASRLREDRQATAQESMAINRKRMQAVGAIRASEKSGLAKSILEIDAERQAGNLQSILQQNMDSASQQYRRNILGVEAERDSRTNQAIDFRNQASANQRSLLDVISQTANTGLTNYINYQALG